MSATAQPHNQALGPGIGSGIGPGIGPGIEPGIGQGMLLERVGDSASRSLLSNEVLSPLTRDSTHPVLTRSPTCARHTRIGTGTTARPSCQVPAFQRSSRDAPNHCAVSTISRHARQKSSWLTSLVSPNQVVLPSHPSTHRDAAGCSVNATQPGWPTSNEALDALIPV